ncbi:MAG TPA: L-threonylcarbamoyladenylate synthase [Burkholderiaceae bacterium]|nr:L-threonylcarbamoyladenylate synthase [Burkholderiaceae bacterium]
MAQLFCLHPANPQLRLLRQAAQLIDHGAVAVVPTDSCYALACHLDDKPAVDRLRRIRNVDANHHLTLLCRDLSEISDYAKVDNARYRMIRQATPGPYTFILEATKEVPRRLAHKSRKTIGIRVPSHPALQGLLEVLGQPLISTTLLLPGDELPLTQIEDIRPRLEREVDLIVDAGACTTAHTTVLDLTGREGVVVREGLGSLEALGLA